MNYFVVWWEDWIGNWDDDSFGPYPSGTLITVKYAYERRYTYTMRAQAIDELGQKSDWAYWKVRISRNKASYNSLFLKLVEQFPILQKILFYLIK